MLDDQRIGGWFPGEARNFYFVILSVNWPGREVDHTSSTAAVNARSYIATRHTSLFALFKYGLYKFTFICMTTNCSTSAVYNLR